MGHIKRFCRDLIRAEKEKRQKAAMATTQENSDSEDSALLASHALSASSEQCKWIIDSGATCHMSFESKLWCCSPRSTS